MNFFKLAQRRASRPRGLMALALALSVAPRAEKLPAGECILCYLPPEGCGQDTGATVVHRQPSYCVLESCLWTLEDRLEGLGSFS